LIGSAPSWPAETWMFWLWMARIHVARVMRAKRFVRIEPDAHRIVAAAEQPYQADAGMRRAGP